MEIKHVYNLVYDVFAGQGWDQWTRVLYARKESKVVPIKGAFLNQKQQQYLLNFFKKEYNDV